jgi:hypothetical protein
MRCTTLAPTPAPTPVTSPRYVDLCAAVSQLRYTVHRTLMHPLRGTRYLSGTYRNMTTWMNGHTL